MQLDSWLFLFFNLTILLAFSGIVFTLFKSDINVHMLETTSIERNQFILRTLILIRFQKYLVIRRMLKQENDDDPPYVSSLVF
ncbi:hypothetical protein [Desulfosporosinus sp. FKB]|uniref:hypothetical protein n=1 Tax=Desulfosporosinus sp. FKB TaxID=1969835 RepID=UPI000B49C1D9|nr:hypothetical protein [Desulfosporosinus sp. FKB]